MSSGSLFDKQMFDSEKNLVSWIKGHSLIMFDEELTWYEKRNTNADLLGTDSEGKFVIIEVKLWSDDPSNRRIQEYSCIGQIIHYASYFIDSAQPENTRLFIIGSSTSELVENSCVLLRERGFNIEHLSVIDRLEREVSRIVARHGIGVQ